MTPAPLHTLVVGASGSGKSVFMNDFLTQTSPSYALTCIIDRGGSFETFTRLAGSQVFVLRPNGSITINYLDTRKLPLTPEHLANATALGGLMIGSSVDEDRQRHRTALITKYLNLLYTDVFEEWARRHSEALIEVACLSCVLSRQSEGDGALLDAFVLFRDWQKLHPEQAQSSLQLIPEAEVTKALKNPQSREIIRNLAFSRFTPSEHPTHSMLVELMQLDATALDREQARRIADQLLPWSRNGSFGVLFDNATNIELNSPTVTFELGQMPESPPEFSAAASLLVTNQCQTHTYALARSLRKRIIFEECSAFLSIPNAERILREAYEQGRKFNTWIVTIFQQYDRLRTSSIRAALLGNSRQFFLFKQHDERDLNALAEDLGLSRSAVEAIRGFALPDEEREGSRFLCVRRDERHTIFGTVINRLSKEMLYASASGGEHFEKRRNEFAQPNSNFTRRLVELANLEPTANP